MTRKKRILLNWWYDRPDLMEPFRKLASEIEFICLFYKQPSEREQHLPYRFVFWADYASPQQLLADTQPDEVVLFSIEDAPYQIGMNQACRRLGIPTTLIDHGLRGFGKIEPPKLVLDATKPQALLFLLRGIGFGSAHLWPKVLKLIGYKLSGSLAGRTDPALRELRRANRYICYSPANARYFLQRDAISESQIFLTGIPAFDAFFMGKTEESSTEPYFLLIDQPLSRSKFNHALFSDTGKRDFLRKLNEYCLRQNHRLFVKLHPDEYDLPELLQHSNIRYMRAADTNALIWQSAGVFGFYSTLLLPAICVKPCLLFRVKEMPLQQEWANLGVVQLLDFYAFRVQDLELISEPRNTKNLSVFAADFLYKTDGNAQERLRRLLLPVQTGQELAVPSETETTINHGT